MTQRQLTELGFKRKDWFDKDEKDDELYTLKFVQYVKQLNSEDAAIEICYGYKTDNGKDYQLIDTDHQLRIGTEYIEINAKSIKKIGKLYKIITGQTITHLIYPLNNR